MVVALAGCTVFPSTFVGIYRQGDELFAAVQACSGVETAEVHAQERGNNRSFAVWEFESATEATVPLGSTDAVLELLRDHRDFYLASNATESTGGLVLFTARDLSTLEDGQILIDDSSREAGKTVTPAEFSALADSMCSDYGY